MTKEAVRLSHKDAHALTLFLIEGYEVARTIEVEDERGTWNIQENDCGQYFVPKDFMPGQGTIPFFEDNLEIFNVLTPKKNKYINVTVPEGYKPLLQVLVEKAHMFAPKEKNMAKPIIVNAVRKGQSGIETVEASTSRPR